MHIYTVTVARLYIIIIISNFARFFLSLLHLHNQHHHQLLLPLIHILPQSKSKINHKNKKSTTKSTTKSPRNTTKPNTSIHGHTNGDRESGLEFFSADRRAWIGVLLAMLGSETERVDRRLWRIGVLGSAFFSPCLDRRQKEWIESSSRRRAPCLDRRQKEWIGVLLGAVLPAWIESSECLD